MGPVVGGPPLRGGEEETEVCLLVEANNDCDETKPSVGRTKDVRAARQVKAVVGLSLSCISVELIKAASRRGCC